MGDKISIIIPVYNVEQYLDRCVQSVIEQTHKNLEIILVDDGSPDNSGKMCDEWAKKDKRIKVVHKQNAGLGMARNSGLDNCTGDYITFLDSDDYLELNTAQLALDKLLKSDADICCYGQIYTYKSGNSLYYTLKELPDSYEGEKIEKEFLANTIAPNEKQSGAPKISMSSCMVLYKSEVLQSKPIRFCSEREIVNEDLIFRFEVCKEIKKVAILKKALYHYCFNGESLTQSYNPKKFKAILGMHKKLYELCEQSDNKELLKQRSDRIVISDIVVSIKQEVSNKNTIGKKEVKKHIKEMINNEVVANTLKRYPISSLPLQTKSIYYAMKHKMIFSIILLSKIKLNLEEKQ